jgi:hypothetical protein
MLQHERRRIHIISLTQNRSKGSMSMCIYLGMADEGHADRRAYLDEAKATGCAQISTHYVNQSRREELEAGLDAFGHVHISKG